MNPLEHMPQLTNRKHEAFAREVATGAPLARAYVAVGYREGKGYDCRHNASRLYNRPHIKARVAELLDEFNRTAFVGLQWVQARLVDAVERSAKGSMRDHISALATLARTLGVTDTSVNVNATATAAAGDPLEINDETRIAALEAFLHRIRLKQPEQLPASNGHDTVEALKAHAYRSVERPAAKDRDQP